MLIGNGAQLTTEDIATIRWALQMQHSQTQNILRQGPRDAASYQAIVESIDHALAALDELQQPLICDKCNDYLEAPSSCEMCYFTISSAYELATQQRWEPLPDDIYNTDGPEVIYVKDALLSIVGETYVYLPDDIRLCRKVTPGEEPTP
jgi:hypothetical protein